MTDTMTAPADLDEFSGGRRLVTAVPGPKSLALHERRLAAVPVGVSSALPVYLRRAHGALVEDVDGNRYIDLGCGIGVTTIGHTNDAVVAAAKAQLDDFLHGMFTITPYESYVRSRNSSQRGRPGRSRRRPCS